MKKPLKVLASLLLLTMAVGCNKEDTPIDNPSEDNTSTNVIVEDKDNSVTIQVTSKVYDGKSINVTANALSGGSVSLLYKVKNADDSTYSADAPKNVGEYTVKASVDKGTGYKKADSTADFSITKKEVEIVWTAPSNLIYDGSAKEATAGVKSDSLIAGDNVTLTYGLTAGKDNVNVGSFTYTVTAISNDNYKLPSNVVSPSYTIGKATPTYNVPTGLTAVYGQTLADVTLPSGFTFESPLSTSVGNAGDNEFLVTYDTNDANYASVNNIAVTISVDKADPTYTVLTGLTATYGDTLGDITTPSGYYFIEDDSTPVGEVGKVTHEMRFFPADGDNYNYVEFNVEIDVKKADPSLSALEAATAKVGDTLANITLPNGYTFMEDVSTLVGPAGSNVHKLTYTPEDTDHFNVINNIDFTINVSKLESSVPSLHLAPLEYREGLKLSDFVLPSDEYCFVNPNKNFNSAGAYQVEVIYQNSDVDTYAPLHFYTYVEIKKAVPTYVVPTGLAGYVGQTLGDINLPAGFKFESNLSTPLGSEGSHYFNVSYTPSSLDLDNYKSVAHIPVAIEVSKRDNAFTSVSCLSKTYDGNPINSPTCKLESDASVTYMYKLQDADESEYSVNKPVNVGSYDIKAIASDTDAYNGAIGYGTVYIWHKKATLEILDTFDRYYEKDTDTIDIQGKYTYDGDGQVTTKYLRINDDATGNVNFPSVFSSDYVDGVPTEVGSYYFQFCASEGANYNSTFATCVISIYSGTSDSRDIQISNLSELTAPWNGTQRRPKFSVDGVIDGDVKFYTKYPFEKGFNSSITIQSAGTYEIIAVKPATETTGVLVKKFKVTVPKGDYEGEVDWYGGNEYLVAYCGQTLKNLTSNGAKSITGGKIYFDDPLDTPVGGPGMHEFSVRFVPTPLKINGVEVDSYNEIVKTDLKVNVYKRTNISTPDEIKSIVLTPETKLSSYDLPQGWSWTNPNTTISAGYANGEFTTMISYAGDDYNEPITSRYVTLNVGKLRRNKAGILISDRNGNIYTRPGGIQVDPILERSENECDLDSYDICVYDTNPLNISNGFIVEFKRIDAPDSEYTTEAPTTPGDYMIRATLFGNNRLETAELIMGVEVKSPRLELVFEDVEENMTYAVLTTGYGNKGYAIAYNGVNLGGEEALASVNPVKIYNMCIDEALCNLVGGDIAVFYNNLADMKMFHINFVNEELKMEKITISEPVATMIGDIETYGGDIEYIESIAAFYTISGENIKETNVTFIGDTDDLVPVDSDNSLDYSKFVPILNIEGIINWEYYGDYIHLLPEGIFPFPFIEEDANHQGFYTFAYGEYVNHGRDEDGNLFYIFSYGDLMYTKYIDFNLDSIEDMREYDSEEIMKTVYCADINMYKLYSFGSIEFFSIDENNNLVWDDPSTYVEETYTLLEDNTDFYVVTLPDGSKITYDFGGAYSYSYDSETNTLVIRTDYLTEEYQGVVLNDEDHTATYYFGELVDEYYLVQFGYSFKVFAYNLNGQLSLVVYGVEDNGTLTYMGSLKVTFNESYNRYETVDHGDYYIIMPDGTLVYEGRLS